jgi:hypothetical protein
MQPSNRSPRIKQLTWGRLEVEGFSPFKDAKLYPGGAREWDWRETGTGHASGIQPADVRELLDHGAEVVVLGKGYHGRLQVHPDTLKLLRQRNIPVHILPTEEAAAKYNELQPHQAVAGLFHSTC